LGIEATAPGFALRDGASKWCRRVGVVLFI
jgi:hypothetical protein